MIWINTLSFLYLSWFAGRCHTARMHRCHTSIEPLDQVAEFVGLFKFEGFRHFLSMSGTLDTACIGRYMRCHWLVVVF